MLFFRCFVMFVFLVASIQTATSQTPTSQNVKKPPPEKTDNRQYKVATFSGSESRISQLYLVQADCTAGPQAEWRVINKPKHGELRFERMTMPISLTASSPKAHCNGKPIDAIGVYYKSKDGFVGEDRITLDVNHNVGFVSRYVYVVDVR